jgi:PAS domain S-box-containing protein
VTWFERRRPARILNVDDNEIGLYTKTRILRQAGFDVIEAANGMDALQAVRTQHPDLVLLDLQLPDVDGFEVCRRIKSDPASARLPVLHITATAGIAPDSEASSAESGADIFLQQPVEPQEIITVVRTLLRLRTTELGLAESEERLRLAIEGANIATWDIDLRDGSAHFSRELYGFLGRTPVGGPAKWELWLDQIHADDRVAVLQAMDRARKTGERFSHEHRIVRRDDGAECWLASYGRVHRDEHGEPTRFMGIALDITARKHAEQQRERVLRLEKAARTEAENLARLKDEFLATLSHELRSPMSAILGWLHLMRSGRLDAEQQTKAIETIERNAQLQNKLINDLLDISRVIAGKLDLKREPVRMQDIIDRAVESVQVAAHTKAVRISTELQQVPEVHYDAARMQQVFVNLLSNAIKFTPEGGTVEIIGRRNGDRYDISVRDNGEGISPELLPHLFERFRQADGSTTRRHGGLGLGLAIVRHLVELHKGTVQASSEGKGKGATFTVRLPLTAAPSGNRSGADGPFNEVAHHRNRNALKGARILVTDDEPSARALMSQVLMSEGADVMTAENASQALEICVRWRPALVVLDIGMPSVDGYSLLQQIRESVHSNSIPAIAVTGYAQEEDRRRALNAGFQVHITKPFDVDEIVAKIARLLSSSAA